MTYEEYLAEQGVGSNVGLDQLPWWEQAHAFGAGGDVPAEQDPIQGYGLDDLYRIKTGLEELWSLQDAANPAVPQSFINELSPDYYSLEQSGEGLLRDIYTEDYQGYKAGVKGLKEGMIKEQATNLRGMGKQGFAGGGTLAQKAQTDLSKYTLGRGEMMEGWEAGKAGYAKDVLASRKSYVDNLWQRYMMFTAQLDDIVEPTGGWGPWEEAYGQLL